MSESPLLRLAGIAFALLLSAGCFGQPQAPNYERSGTEDSCTDGVDDDGDGWVDCADPDCWLALACAEDCDDGIDNDEDGLVDCNDPICTDDLVCAEDCSDGVDNDADSLVDCGDPDCSRSAFCPEDCANGVDDNADLAVDCDDVGCACAPEEDANACTNGRDDDLDRLTDCDDPDCEDLVQCTCEAELRGGVCLTEPWDGEFDGPLSYISNIQVPRRGSDAECCFDFDGDGNTDNGFGLFLGAMAVLDQNLDIDEEVSGALEFGGSTRLVAWAPPSSDGYWLYDATNDLDGDGAPDDSFDDRLDGMGLFELLPDSGDEFGAHLQFNLELDDGWFGAGTDPIVVPLPFAFIQGLTPVPLLRARIRGDVFEDSDGGWSSDHEFDSDGELIEFGGIELAGVLHLDDLAALFERELQGCECARFNADSPIVTTGVDGDGFWIACAQGPAGDCSADRRVGCRNVELVCGVLPSLTSFRLNDFDSDGDGIGDSMSVGVRLTAVPGTLTE